jgi:hypothetical protein
MVSAAKHLGQPACRAANARLLLVGEEDSHWFCLACELRSGVGGAE